ncbi:isoprenylcysteine carboxylmethyltransferase family protein [Emcibacter sp.]|uniref:methyltransferase family protein n=1 Tax=Emcibacter sp. TaxID=1979954 RepID=UPI002AA8A8CB|nr:isoprenylcysteine carboxylmethyltransferase family protein [Emcibacter sp.]
MAEIEIEDHANVIIRPPVIYALGLGFAVALDYFMPLYLGLGKPAALIGWILLAVGFILLGGSVISFIKNKQNPDPLTPTDQIYTGGLYAVSRNPIYLGFTLIYIALGLIFGSLWMFIALIPVLMTMHFGVILREEAYLTEKFGASYLDYKNKVRRWI